MGGAWRIVMHFAVEVIMPPVEDVETTVKHLMYCGNDNYLEEGADPEPPKWWDYYVIGGRWSGNKLIAKIDPALIEKFYAELKDKHITVSGIQFGKQEISPIDQIPMVDLLWREIVPGKGDACPLFKHGRPGTAFADDICKVSEIPAALKCEWLIVGDWDHCGKLNTSRLIATSLWNGVEHQDTGFDGFVLPMIGKIIEQEGYRRVKIQPDWLCVTVDCHN